MGRVVLLTGERGVGKTTVCFEAVERTKQRGHACGGILTLVDQGDRYVVDVATGDRRLLTAGPGESQTVTQGRFHFNLATLNWGEGVLWRATPCDLLVIDEIGPLEIERGQGWAGGLDVLREATYALALLVVRPELVAPAQAELSGCSPEVLTVTRENRDGLPARLVEMVEGAVSASLRAS